MRLDIHLHHHADPVDTRVVDKIDLISAQLEILMDALDRIEAAAARQTTLEASIAAMVTDLKHQVSDALANTKLPADVEARLAAIFPTLEANNDRLTSILTDNTGGPAAPIDPAATSAIGTTSTDVSGAGGNTGAFATSASTDELPASSS